MNARDKELYQQATGKEWAYDFDVDTAEKFAALTRADERKSIVTMLKDEVNVETAADCIWAIEARGNT